MAELVDARHLKCREPVRAHVGSIPTPGTLMVQYIFSKNIIYKFLTWTGNLLLATFWSLFVYINIYSFIRTGSISLILGALNESIIVCFFLLREDAIDVSSKPLDWGIAFAATFFPTLLRPSAISFSLIGVPLLLIGIVLNISSLLFLNRSFGIVPARRTIKTKGPYHIIRHPMYASYFLIIVGYLVGNVSLLNVVVVVGTIALMAIRLLREEMFLMQDKSYQTYCKATPFRLIPFIY